LAGCHSARSGTFACRPEVSRPCNDGDNYNQHGDGENYRTGDRLPSTETCEANDTSNEGKAKGIPYPPEHPSHYAYFPHSRALFRMKGGTPNGSIVSMLSSRVGFH
jgi:hypothetical protein